MTEQLRLLSELPEQKLKAMWAELHAKRSELKAIIAETRRSWLVEGKKTPPDVRADMDAKLASTQAEIASVELEIQRRRDAETELKKSAKLDFWHWSDQMLAALTHLLEANGHSDLLKQAKKMVASGWPNTQK